MNDSWSNLDDLMECYNDTLVSIFDKHAPIRKKITVGKRKLPWFSANVKHLKTERRKLERKMRKSKQNIDRAAYRKICNKYSALLKEARRKYYTDLIDECSNDSKKLFKVVTSLCKAPRDEPQLPSHDDLSQLTNMFGEYFYRKIELIRNDIDNITIDPQPVEYRRPEVKLESFTPVSDQEIHDIIMQSSNASCELDPIPTWLVKLCSNELTPILTKIINLSLEEGHVPDAWKIALLKPFLKKSGLEAVFENFRPVCNLSFISKSAEKAVIEQLFEHCDENAPLPSSQSAYRKNYSTETALLKVQNDILMSMDKQEVILLVLLDLSSAFDTIDHKLMLDTLEFDFGVTGKALLWLKSFLSDRKQRVHIKKEFSKDYNVNHGVPQGSCLGPVLFLLYISQLFDVVSRHLPSAHGYADDTQLYMSFRPESSIAQNQAMLALEECITDMRSWLLTHKLMFKDSKTEFLIIGTRQQLSKIQIDSVKVGGVDIKPVEKVRNLGSWFDNHMSMNIHVGKVCSKAFRGLYNIRQIRKFLSMDSTKTLIHAFVTSHLDYCNSLLAGIPQYQLQRLQKVLNAAARLIYQTSNYKNIQYDTYKNTKDVLSTIRKQHEDKLNHHLISQGSFFSNVMKYSTISFNSIWSSVQSKLPKNIFNFTIRYINNTLPTRKNLHKWGVSTTSECAFCLSPESLLHIVAGCKTYLNEGRFTWRHDSVLNLIASTLKSLNYSNLYVDLPGYLSPSVITGDTLRPDLVLTIENKCFFILELTIGFESNLQTNATRKREKYQDLINKQLNYYEEAKFVNVSISSLGVFSETSLDLVEMLKDLEMDMHCRKYLVRKIINTCIRSTYYIFCKRNKEWDNPELMSY